MSCDRYAGAIVDHACGAEIAADAAGHLQVCAACSRRFDEQRRVLQDLDEELQSALSIEPSARFVAETMAGVERSSLRWRTVMWWSGPAAAAAVLIVLTLGSLRFGERHPIDREEPAALRTGSAAPVGDRAPSIAAPPASAGGVSPSSAAGRRAERTKVIGRERGTRVEADVVVPAAQSQAIERYLSLVRRGALDTSALANSGRTGAVAPSELVIAPLSVETLVVTDAENGMGPSVDGRGPR